MGVRNRNHLTCSGEGGEKKTQIEVSPEKGGAPLSPCPNEMPPHINDRGYFPHRDVTIPDRGSAQLCTKGGNSESAFAKENHYACNTVTWRSSDGSVR